MYNKTGRTTLEKVASVAGASTQAVSRVISEKLGISSDSLTPFQEVIEKLDDQSSAPAHNLIHERSYTLDVVILLT